MSLNIAGVLLLLYPLLLFIGLLPSTICLGLWVIEAFPLLMRMPASVLEATLISIALVCELVLNVGFIPFTATLFCLCFHSFGKRWLPRNILVLIISLVANTLSLTGSDIYFDAFADLNGNSTFRIITLILSILGLLILSILTIFSRRMLHTQNIVYPAIRYIRIIANVLALLA